MTQNSEVSVVEAEKNDGGVLIGFSNGRTALYSVELLYSMIAQAKEFSISNEGDEADG